MASATAVAALLSMTAAATAALPAAGLKQAAVAQESFIGREAYRDARGGCGSKSGPGYRKSNGQCAGWRG